MQDHNEQLRAKQESMTSLSRKFHELTNLQKNELEMRAATTRACEGSSTKVLDMLPTMDLHDVAKACPTSPLGLGDLRYPIANEHIRPLVSQIGALHEEWKESAGKISRNHALVGRPSAMKLCQDAYGCGSDVCSSNITVQSQQTFSELNAKLKAVMDNADNAALPAYLLDSENPQPGDDSCFLLRMAIHKHPKVAIFAGWVTSDCWSSILTSSTGSTGPCWM